MIKAATLVQVGLLVGLVLSLGSLLGRLLPVLGGLEAIQLPFTRSVVVDGLEQQHSVTVVDLLQALLILAGTIFAIRNFAGLLEFTLLRKLRMDAGGRYALVTLSQYTLAAIGIISALTLIGLPWSKLQWLVAALGVGLGFGLQEIVANFVSGIILLIERPIRIGDIVSVDDKIGAVAKIRIRATTILTYEQHELIVPNKEFITSKVLNWTLSDGTNRILLNVGIAYGANSSQAMQLMAEAAEDNEYVLTDPKPIISFEGFGDNALKSSTALLSRFLGVSIDSNYSTTRGHLPKVFSGRYRYCFSTARCAPGYLNAIGNQAATS